MNPLKANEMPHQEPLVRNKNFLEVATGYDAQTAMDELRRIEAGQGVNDDLVDTIQMIATIMNGMQEDFAYDR